MRSYYRKSSVIENVPETILDRLVENLTFTSSVGELDEKIEQLIEFKELGLTELALGLHDDPMSAIKIIGEKVVPALA